MSTDRDGPLKERAGRSQTRPAPNNINRSRHATTDLHGNTGSRQVSWETVHSYVQRVVATAGFPMVGTPEWCRLPDDDPRKAAAIYSAAEHWALYIEGNQRALAQASRDVSAAADWPAVARHVQQRREFHATNPWSRRVTT
jgi:Protein of unknown function (DUF2742)